MDSVILFYLLLFVVAFLYASVGHGGASGYLALMALFNIAPAVMKPTALLLNLFVSLTSFIQFYRGGHFRWKIFWPFVFLSIPLAYVGGRVIIDAFLYKRLLGILLLIPIIRFFFFTKTEEIQKEQSGASALNPTLEMQKENDALSPLLATRQKQESNLVLSLLIGGLIGFLSGLIGIGGGILLSPVLLLLKWTDQKETAAISALFIFVNSLSGLAGQLKNGIGITPDMYTYVVIAFMGGLCGAYFGALKFRQTILKNVLATVLLLAVYKLLFTTA